MEPAELRMSGVSHLIVRFHGENGVALFEQDFCENPRSAADIRADPLLLSLFDGFDDLFGIRGAVLDVIFDSIRESLRVLHHNLKLFRKLNSLAL